MYAEVAWVLAFSGIQVQPQVILDPDYLPDYLLIMQKCSFLVRISLVNVNKSAV